MDAIEQDIEKLTRFNEYAMALSESQRSTTSLRPLEHLLISPSADIGELAVQKANKLPRIIRYLLKGLGSLQDASEIISYLMFEPSFCADLVEIGRKDGLAQRETIINFLLK
jgi:NTE family protein